MVPTGIVTSFNDSFWMRTVSILISTALLGITVDNKSTPAGRGLVVELQPSRFHWAEVSVAQLCRSLYRCPPAGSSRGPGPSYFTHSTLSSSSFCTSAILSSLSFSGCIQRVCTADIPSVSSRNWANLFARQALALVPTMTGGPGGSGKIKARTDKVVGIEATLIGKSMSTTT